MSGKINTDYPPLNYGKIPSNYICRYCNKIFKNVVQADCGCRYCSNCLSDLLKVSNQCKTCGDNLPDIKMLDKAFQKELNNFIVDCDQCDWKGKLCEYREHYDVKHPHVSCDHCKETFKDKNSLDDHLNNDKCPFKPEKCLFHECNCNEIITKTTRDEHYRTNAPKHLDFMFSYLNKKITTIEEQSSVEPMDVSTSETTSSLVARGAGGLKTPDLSVSSSTSKSNKTKLMTRGDSSDIVPKKAKQSTSSPDTDSAKFSMLDFNQKAINDDFTKQKQLYELVREDVESIKNKEKKIREELDQLNKSLNMAQTSIISLEERLLTQEKASYNGVLIWKITNVQDKMIEARNGRQTSIYSQPFYTTPCGYKMCGRVYLNGDGMGRGTHLSLFFALMKSDYDPLLKWPFRQKVTFILIDQSPSKKENIIDAFRPDPNSNSFKKPTSDMNIASGIPLFCPLTKIISNEHEYIKDDTLFIKIVVDIRDLVDI